MPKLDGTGPMGQGAGTGLGLGGCYCGHTRRCCGFRGFCGFFSRRFTAPKNEAASLEDQEQVLKEELAAIQREKAALKDK